VDPVLECAGVRKAFGAVEALAGVDLTFRPGAITALIGPNGAGKTTLLNVLTGFVQADAGSASLNGVALKGLAPDRVARLGIARTFQDLRLIRAVPVLDNVMLARPRQRGEHLLRALSRIGVAPEEAANRAESLRLLELVHLRECVEMRAGELSYGQQKLLALACCLATDARVLLLDEPVAGVHPGVAEQVFAVLRRVRAEGRLVIFVEHDLAAVRELADVVVVMEGGRVIAEGPPDQVLERPRVLEAYLA